MAVNENNKIRSTEAGYQNVSRLEGDTLTGTVLQNKQQFDVYPNLIKDHFNVLVDDIISDLGNKVDRSSGKGLSTNDYTDADKATVGTVPSLASSVASQGSSISTLQTTVSNKVDKVSGKGLSTNDYTTNEKNKLAGIASGAEVNVQADWNVTDTNSDAYIKNKPTIADTVSAGTGLTKSGNTINHKNSVTAGTIGSSSATSGLSIAIPYATYDAQGHITSKGTHTHTVSVAPSDIGATIDNYGSDDSVLNAGRFSFGGLTIEWGNYTDATISNGYTTIYTERYKYRPAVVITSFYGSTGSHINTGLSYTVQPMNWKSSSTADRKCYVYVRNGSTIATGTCTFSYIIIGETY